jgi:hypothetical protein
LNRGYNQPNRHQISNHEQNNRYYFSAPQHRPLRLDRRIPTRPSAGGWRLISIRQAYQRKTIVFAVETVHGFRNAEPVATLDSHAPEVIRDSSGRHYISSAEWPLRGISLAPLEWGSGSG